MATRIKSQTYKGLGQTALLLGAGYSARALIPHLLSRGYDVVATIRSETKAQSLKAFGITPIIYNGTLSAHLKTEISQADIILSSIPPNDQGDPFLNSLERPLAQLAKNAHWVGYLSATSVYGDRKGQWAFEGEWPKPLTRRGKNRANAELQWLETQTPIHVFRLAGIYGPKQNGVGRNGFNRLRSGKARAVIKPGHIVNRIHVDDIATALLASIERPNPLRIYNLADDTPAPPQDVLNFSADLINCDRPPKLNNETANISDMARSFYLETKRISNTRAKKELGWVLKYKNYRQGLLATFQAEKGDKDAVYLAGYIDVPKADLKSVKLALPTHIRLTHQEPDCTDLRIWQDEDIPTRFHVFETFKSPIAFERHQARMKNSEWAIISKNASRHYDITGI